MTQIQKMCKYYLDICGNLSKMTFAISISENTIKQLYGVKFLIYTECLKLRECAIFYKFIFCFLNKLTVPTYIILTKLNFQYLFPFFRIIITSNLIQKLQRIFCYASKIVILQTTTFIANDNRLILYKSTTFVITVLPQNQK